MKSNESLEVLRKADKTDVSVNNALKSLQSEIRDSFNDDLELILCNLVIELRHSTSPVLSYRILWAIRYSGGKKLENSFILRQLFINKKLGSESVLDGLSKCIQALTMCTKYLPTNEATIADTVP